MLDENLPTFYLKQSKQDKNLWTFYLCHHGNEPSPAYTLRYPDPTSASSRNRYAVALCDPFVPDIIYGEVLLMPEWTQPSLSAEAIRQNNSVTPPPEPILPAKFTVHLYNPDQQITIAYKPKTWNSPATWAFEMPQYTFRQPSSSSLDRTQIDPAVADVTPKLRFGWRKDSKLSKDLACLLSGKTAMIPDGSDNNRAAKKSKEPDITISIFKGLREMTMYEPNLYRVEMEDFKGLEVVLLLGAVTIRDVWFCSVREAFRVDHSVAKTQAAQRPAQKPVPKPVPSSDAVGAANGNPTVASGALNARPGGPERPRLSIPRRDNRPIPQVQPQPGPTPGPQPDGGPSEEASAEMHRQKKNLEDQKERQRRFFEQERAQRDKDKARRKNQAEIEKETKRLQKIYGKEEEQVRRAQKTPQPQSHHQSRSHSHSHPRPAAPQSRPAQRPVHAQPSRPHLPPRPGPYLQASHPHVRHSSVQFVPMQQPQQARPNQGPLQQKKSSFFGLRRSADDRDKLVKKRSSMF